LNLEDRSVKAFKKASEAGEELRKVWQMKNTYWKYHTDMFGNDVVISEKWILIHNTKAVAEFRRKK